MEPAPDPIEIAAPADDTGAAGWCADPAGWTDQLTGTDGPRLWERLLSSEAARVKRYRAPATIVLAQFLGIDRFSTVWGGDAAGRLFIQLARTLAVEVRSSDHIARLGSTRFGILLVETDEIAAINFVERARAACDRQIRTPDLVSVAFGWAGPTAASDLWAAVDVASERLTGEIGDQA